jgi:hypothetical protein
MLKHILNEVSQRYKEEKKKVVLRISNKPILLIRKTPRYKAII